VVQQLNVEKVNKATNEDKMPANRYQWCSDSSTD